MNELPITFLHGFLGGPSMWNAVEATLHARVVDRLVLPGHGGSPWFPPEPADFFSSVDAIAQSLPPSQQVMLVGYSMGARVALALALRHPEKVHSAILIGVDAGIEDEAMRAERVAWDDAWSERAKNEGIEALASAWEDLPIFETQKRLSEDSREALRQQRTSHTPVGIAWAMRTLGLGRMPSLWSLLERNETPITLMSGALDRKFTDKSWSIVRRAKNVRAVVVEDVGHNVALEAPRFVANAIAAETKMNITPVDLSASATERTRTE